MIRSVLAFLLLLAACADVPDQLTPDSSEIDVLVDELYYRALPEQLIVRPQAVTANTAHFVGDSMFFYGWKYWGANNYYLMYTPQPIETHGATMHGTRPASTGSCVAWYSGGFWCDNVYYACPNIGFSAVPENWQLGNSTWMGWYPDGDANYGKAAYVTSNYLVSTSTDVVHYAGSSWALNCHYAGAVTYGTNASLSLFHK